MSLEDRIQWLFSASIQALHDAEQQLSDGILATSERLAQCLLSDGKVLVCGNGGSASLAQHFAAKMLNRFQRERPALPAMALSADTATITAIADEYSFNEVYSKQIRALGHEQDLLLTITNEGKAANIVQAIQAAHDRGMSVIALSGIDGGDAAALLHNQDIEIRVPAEDTPRVQELQLFTLHAIADLIDQQIFGTEF